MSFSAMQYKTQKLITAVHNQAVLWNPDHPEYKDKRTKDEAWLEICRIMVKGFDEISKVERKLIEREFRKRWKNIRDCYNRELRRANGSGKRWEHKKYIYFNLLQFLSTIDRKKNTENNNKQASDMSSITKTEEIHLKMEYLSDGESYENYENSKDNKFILYDPTAANSDVNDDDTDVAFASENGEDALERIESKMDALGRALNNFRENRNDAQDEDQLFLMSLLSDLKTIPLEKKLHAKCELMKVLINYKD